MKKFWWLMVLPLVAIVWWAAARRSAPPDIPFTRVSTETIVDTLSTNGRVEPIEWQAIRVEREGIITRLAVRQGQNVTKGQAVAELDTAEARIALASAETRVAQARAELELLHQGGRASEIAEINGQITRLKQELEAAQREFEVSERLSRKSAATRQEVELARDRVEQLRVQIRTLESKRSALVAPTDRAVAEAKLRDAETAVEAVRRRLDLSLVRSPMSGTAYHVEARAGSYLHAGDLVANVGRLERLRVSVYVDEPDLGRVAAGMPVTITWDALPGRTWQGVVERIATQIVRLESRQVGEVVSVIGNPGRDLSPGANINVAIRSRVAENAVALPKECMRREGGVAGVYVLNGDRVSWRPLKTGVSSVARVQVLEGLKAGDLVALPTDKPLADGDEVRPVVR